MSVRNGLWSALGLALTVMLSGAVGCETAQDWNYYAEVKGAGPSTSEKTDVPQLMQQMRVANLKLVDSLTYMSTQDIMTNSVQMYELARALSLTQPAVALQSPEDVAKYKKLADDLAEIIVQVGAAARDKHQEAADANYAQAFLLCNRCHLQFRAVTAPKPLSIPEVEKPTTPTPAPATPEGGATPPPAGGAGTEPPKPVPAP